ncbi:MAG: rod shape-determining protein MreC, partial [Bacillota bacterium]|nr:rod shape-determining protein MreC [Bacillota bacterium]
VLEGIGGGKGLLTMSNLPFDANIQLNDVVVTSGEGGIFPAGLLVGSVVKVGNSIDGLSRQAVIEPFCDFNSIEEVLVMIPVEKKEADEDIDGETEDSGDVAPDPEDNDGSSSDNASSNDKSDDEGDES